MKPIMLWAFLFLVLAVDASACSCVSNGDAEPMPAGSIVFRGKVVATELVVVGDDGNMFLASQESGTAGVYRVAVLEVLEKFIGNIPPFVIIATGSGGGDCGYPFQVGKSYVVDGGWTEDETLARLGGSARVVTTTICSLTAPSEQRAAMLSRLRKRHKAASPLFVR